MSHYALPRAVALALPITLGAWTVQAADIIQTAERDGRFNGFLQLLAWIIHGGRVRGGSEVGWAAGRGGAWGRDRSGLGVDGNGFGRGTLPRWSGR